MKGILRNRGKRRLAEGGGISDCAGAFRRRAADAGFDAGGF